jgi:hypothetical protein
MPYAGSLGLVQPTANRVFQRDVRTGDPSGGWRLSFGQGWGAIPFTISPTVIIGTLEYRVRDAAAPTSTILLDWTVCGRSLPVGPQSIALTVPARTGWHLLDIRANGDDSSIVSTLPLGMGEVIAASGQSLASDFWGTAETGDPTTIPGSGISVSPFGVCLAAWDGAAAPSAGSPWQVPGDASLYRSTFCAEFLRLAVRGSGVNCALIGYAWSGEPIASWRADGLGPKNAWGALTSTLDAAVGVGGKLGTFVWCQGHNDARIPQSGVDGSLTKTADYFTALGPIFSGLASRYSGFAFARILSSVPAIGANWISTNPRFLPAYIEQVREAQLLWVQADPLAVDHVDGLDVPLWSDQTHPSQGGNIVLARHVYRAFMRGLGVYAFGDRGPLLTGLASRAPGSNQIVLFVAHRGGSSLLCAGGSTGAATQFQVFGAGSTLPADQIPVVSADLAHPGVIVLSLAAAPPDAAALDVWYRLPPDSNEALNAANQIYDNNSSELALDGLTVGRQLALSATPISVSAPAWHRPILVGPQTPMLTAFGLTGFAV